jgi:hypothetical protein
VAKISTVGPEARGRLLNIGKGYQDRAPYRDAIASLDNGQILELEPDEGETMRRVKLIARRAANEAGKEIQYGETEQGSLLLWIAEPKQLRRRRRVSAD